MRFGLDCAQQRMPWDELVSRVQFAEQLGFDGAWGFDHFQPMYGEGPGETFDGVTTLAALSGVTSRIRLGLLVAGATYRHPSIFENVTERKLAEQSLRESQARYQALIETSVIAVYVNRRDRVALVNPACVRLFGAERGEELLGRSPYELFHPDCHERIRERIRRLRDDGVPVASEIEQDDYGRFAWAVDPEGNRFELWEPAPGR